MTRFLPVDPPAADVNVGEAIAAPNVPSRVAQVSSSASIVSNVKPIPHKTKESRKGRVNQAKSTAELKSCESLLPVSVIPIISNAPTSKPIKPKTRKPRRRRLGKSFPVAAKADMLAVLEV